MNKKSQQYLLALARQTLVDYYETGKKIKLNEGSLPDPALSKNAATFVTLTKDDKLRGCVGSLIPKKKMYEDVINNALLAGFGDPRFPQLAREEIAEVKIEISILSKPEPFVNNSVESLLKEIIPWKDGLVLQQGLSQSTFLPDVWNELPTTQEFLEALSQKAGLDKDAWKSSDTEIFHYKVEKFSE